VPQKVAWKFLSARQTSVLGRDSLELLDKRMGWRVAEHIDGTSSSTLAAEFSIVYSLKILEESTR
jgi:hypothetical protein